MADVHKVSTSEAGMVDNPIWLQATGGDTAIPYSASADRSLIQGLWPQEGILYPEAFKITPGSGLSLNIAIGEAIVQGDTNTDQGAFKIQSTAVINITTPPAPGSGSQTHRIVAEVLDKQATSIAGYGWRISVLDGSAGYPALPNSALQLGRVVINAGDATIPSGQIYNEATLASQWKRGPQPAGLAPPDPAGEYGYAAGAPVCSLIQTTLQTIAASTWTDLTFGSTGERDPLDGHGGSNSYYTCPVAGLYLCLGGMTIKTLTANTAKTDMCGARFTKNGTAVGGSAAFVGFQQIGADQISTVTARPRTVYCVRGDLLRVQGWHGWSGNIDTFVTNDDVRSYFEVILLGP